MKTSWWLSALFALAISLGAAAQQAKEAPQAAPADATDATPDTEGASASSSTDADTTPDTDESPSADSSPAPAAAAASEDTTAPAADTDTAIPTTEERAAAATPTKTDTQVDTATDTAKASPAAAMPADGDKTADAKSQNAAPKHTDTDGKADAAAAGTQVTRQDPTTGRNAFSVAFVMAQPFAALRDHADKFSLQGIDFAYRFSVLPQLGVGIAFSWNSFAKKQRGAFDLGQDVTVVGSRVRSSEVMTLAATAAVTRWNHRRTAGAYGALLAGAGYVRNAVDYAWWSTLHSRWHPLLAPELGVRLLAGPVPLSAALRYTFLLPTGGKYRAMLGIHLGIAWNR